LCVPLRDAGSKELWSFTFLAAVLKLHLASDGIISLVVVGLGL
jgi:hypothetical protein